MLYTIGTSNRDGDDFFRQLDRRGVHQLVDVRSSPYSRSPWAGREALQIAATRHGIQYAWSGSLLGGRHPIPTTHRDYQIAADAVLDATDAGPVAIFCAEGDPAQCHRSWKVAAYLLVQHGVVASNILRNGQEEDVMDTLRRTRPVDVPACLRDDVRRIISRA